MVSPMCNYEIMEQIGRGAFGAAILVIHKSEKKKYVLKKIRLARQSERCRKSAYQEMALISRMRHPYIVEFKEAWVEKGCYVCIVTDYCEGGDMAELMKISNGSYFSEKILCKWFTQMVLALEYLHSKFVLHRDVKCSNIFLTKDLDVRLGDFGLAKTLKADDLTSSVVGTPNYMCPELLSDIPYGFKSDIWSLGCCIYEMAAHRPAFKAFDMAGLVNKVNRSSIGPLPTCYSSSLKSLIKSMLRKNPDARPTASEILKNPYLQPYVDQYRPSFIPPPAFSSPERSIFGSPGRRRHRRSNSTSGARTNTSILVQPEDILVEKISPIPDSIPYVSPLKKIPETTLLTQNVKSNKDDISKHTPNKPRRQTHLNPQKIPTPEKTKPYSSMGRRKATPDKTQKLEKIHNFDTKTDQNTIPKPTISEFSTTDSPKKLIPFSNGSEKDGLFASSTPVSEVCCGDDDGTAPASPCLDRVIHVIQHSSLKVGNNCEEALDVKSTRQRSEALENLLELSADLLQNNRLEELAVVLKPFGRDKVSPRETAIWLARSLKGMMTSGGCGHSSWV